MSNINPVSPSPFPTTSSATPPPDTGLGEDAFLKLLTTQMQNQDPTSPLANEDFIAQLAQFTSVEELGNIGSALDAVYMGIASLNNATMTNLLGAEVVAVGDKVSVGPAPVTPIDLSWRADAPISGATLTVRDESGKVVRTIDLGAIVEGEGSVSWDGLAIDGQPVPEGSYTFEVNGTDAEGAMVGVQTLTVGTIDEMDYSGPTPLPMVGGEALDLADIVRVRKP